MWLVWENTPSGPVPTVWHDIELMAYRDKADKVVRYFEIAKRHYKLPLDVLADLYRLEET